LAVQNDLITEGPFNNLVWDHRLISVLASDLARLAWTEAVLVAVTFRIWAAVPARVSLAVFVITIPFLL
jgi:hypothetical protein